MTETSTKFSLPNHKLSDEEKWLIKKALSIDPYFMERLKTRYFELKDILQDMCKEPEAMFTEIIFTLAELNEVAAFLDYAIKQAPNIELNKEDAFALADMAAQQKTDG